jgi:hypothetical protein
MDAAMRACVGELVGRNAQRPRRAFDVEPRALEELVGD